MPAASTMEIDSLPEKSCVHGQQTTILNSILSSKKTLGGNICALLVYFNSCTVTAFTVYRYIGITILDRYRNHIVQYFISILPTTKNEQQMFYKNEEHCSRMIWNNLHHALILIMISI